MCGTIPTGIDVKRSFLTEMCNPLHSTRNQWRCSRTRNRKQNRKKKIFEYCHKKEILTNMFFNIIVNNKHSGCLIIRVVLYLPEIGKGIRHFVFLAKCGIAYTVSCTTSFYQHFHGFIKHCRVPSSGILPTYHVFPVLYVP